MRTFLDMFNYKVRAGRNFLFLFNVNKKNKNIIKKLKPFYSLFLLKNSNFYLNKIKNKVNSNFNITYSLPFKFLNIYYFSLNEKIPLNLYKRKNFFYFYYYKNYNYKNKLYYNFYKNLNFKKFGGIDIFDNV